ncbi:MAG: DEAD/DEAH box helicase family protein [Chloroflexi bacterium]|nr:DEAD/DEAH box helicase family protein [Chloroflexota bacterium]
MPKRKTPPPEQISLLEVRVKTAPCVPAVRRAVADWRAGGYKGITDTTRSLLNYWFKTDHRSPVGGPFRYHDSQREAMETLIYVFEVAAVRRHKALLEKYAPPGGDIRLLQHDDFPRFCIKMATGSGKTKVMALAAAWQYFNAVVEGRNDCARSFLVIAPNVIVFERLKTDFAGGAIFKNDPVIPPELKIFWDVDCYMRGDAERASSQGALYLTNIQQFYEGTDRAQEAEPQEMTAVLGPKPPASNLEIEDFDKRLAKRGGPCLVINDEAHHTHDEESEWNRAIRRLHTAVPGGLAGQLDFTATPRYSKGALFTWVIYDYPLKQAILDGIVKRPIKGIASNIQESPSDIASTKYRAYLTAGVERWTEYREQLKTLNKKPVLFVMMNDTSEADDVGDYLKVKYPAEFGGDRLQVIHTDKTGDVSKAQLDQARKVVREVDLPESPVNAIVSVLMLREGWDVKNVTVVVGLRPYSAKANILPEQTIGRGLRLMFRDLGADYTERVDVIGNKAFIEFVEQLEKDEEMQLDTFKIGIDRLVIVTVFPDPAKKDRDISMPVLSPILARKKSLAEEIASLNVAAMSCPVLPLKEGDATARTFRYEGYDIITLEKLIERQYTIPEVQTPQEVISYYAKRISQDVKLPSQFAALVPKVREFLETRAFGQKVNLDDPAIIKAMSTNVAQYVTVKTFVDALRKLVVEELKPQLLSSGRKLSETPPFPFSRITIEAKRTVFNLVACDNEFEKTFARFLEKAGDVASFAKLPPQFGFAIEYTDAVSNLRYYEPDFVAVLTSGLHYLIETKGLEDIDVAHKDRAARLWCENATALTGTAWEYLKVPEKDFEKLQPADVADIIVLKQPGLF